MQLNTGSSMAAVLFRQATLEGSAGVQHYASLDHFDLASMRLMQISNGAHPNSVAARAVHWEILACTASN